MFRVEKKKKKKALVELVSNGAGSKTLNRMILNETKGWKNP